MTTTGSAASAYGAQRGSRRECPTAGASDDGDHGDDRQRRH